MAPHRAPIDRAEPPPVSLPTTEPRGQGGVPAGLPWDVRVEPDEAGVPDQVDALGAGGSHEFGQRERRAPPRGAVGVVYSDTDRPTLSESEGETSGRLVAS